MTGADGALLQLLRSLGERGYHFVAPTPATHARVIARADKGEARDLRDIFGWSLPFARDTLPQDLFALLNDAGMLRPCGEDFRSEVRVASLGSLLFLHSAFPTNDRDAVFFGPDSYRFARFIMAEHAVQSAERLIDVGAGAGIGAIVALAEGGVRDAVLTDVNPLALRFARINAAFAGVAVETRPASDGCDTAGFPLVIMNPPFIADAEKRAYRDGGGSLGAELSIDWAVRAALHLVPGGRVLLYSGSAIVDGEDRLASALRAGLPSDCTLSYVEVDPDIFGEELEQPAYAEVERIAAIGAVIRRAG